MPARYLALTDVANRIGIAEGTIRSYSAKGMLLNLTHTQVRVPGLCVAGYPKP
ncbi:hypothetical protein [Mobiluncus curtisii]|uniref:hypothetical protein n=1 Tax=Mobiluncus curtisii TaxID=2051 RepID=UPI003D27AD07